MKQILVLGAFWAEEAAKAKSLRYHIQKTAGNKVWLDQVDKGENRRQR